MCGEGGDNDADLIVQGDRTIEYSRNEQKVRKILDPARDLKFLERQGLPKPLIKKKKTIWN